MDKKSFLIYLDYEEQFNLLSDEQIGQLMRAIFQYEKTGQEPVLDSVLKMAFSFIKTQLDRDRQKYENKCEKNRENGTKGGRPKKKPNGFQKSERLKQKPKKADKEEDKEEDNDKDKEKDTDLHSKNDVEEIQNILLNTLGNTNLTVIQEAISYLDDLPLEVIKEALLRTARKQKKWDYAKGTLNNWIAEGLDTLRKIEVKDIEFKNKNKPKEETEEEKFARKLRELEESLDESS